jgi:hypothetical protein
MNNIKELTELYGVTAKTPDSLNIFITEVYSHGYHDGKEFSSTPISLRDHFAGLAMQGLLASDINTKWDENDIALIAYGQADAMMERREK